MFKQIIIMIIFIFISYFVTQKIYKGGNKFYFCSDTIKYPLICKIKKSIPGSIIEIQNQNDIVFYTREKINYNNYIYDTINDYYYLIEPGYYYYIKNSIQNIIHFKDNFNIFFLKIK